jgi:glycosyltransferase involved in cell wall biosynthesis
MKISVIICTFNPRQDYLQRTLDALVVQTLNYKNWELVLVDNNSTNGIPRAADLTWNSAAKYVCEPKQGLTAARIRGINESSGDVLVFVDDDNVLDANYLRAAMEIMEKHPTLGAWGSAKIIPEYEINPDPRVEPYTIHLALRNDSNDRVGDNPRDKGFTPYGVGLCCLRSVASAVVDNSVSNPVLAALDRSGSGLLSGGDIQFSYEAVKLGMKIGTFTALSVVHLIPQFRITERYLRECRRGHMASDILLDYANSGKRGWSWRRKLRFLKDD